MPFITPIALFDAEHSVNAGFAVDDSWGPGRIETSGAISLYATIAVRDVDGWLFRVGYEVSTLGTFIDWVPSPE